MKIFNRIAGCITASVIFITTIICCMPTALAVEDPDLKCEAAILVEASNKQILYSKNIYELRAPASLTKMMTVMLAVEAVDAGEVSLDDVVTVPDDAYYDITPDGSTANLKAGEEISLKDLLYCAMLSSANEACNTIAVHVSGSTSAFVALMNKRATELGCECTHFANTHGMPNDSHYTSAYDLYLIANQAVSYPLFKQIVSTVSYKVPATNLSKQRELKNTNQLLRPENPNYYEYAAGVKTGYTDAAGYCLISTASKEGRDLISVVLGAKSVILDDGSTQTQSFSETKRLFQWGFDNFSYQEIISTLNLVAEVPVELGTGSSTVVLRPEKGITALLPNDVDVSKAQLKTRVFSQEKGESLVAPISQGTVLGEISVSLNGVDYGRINLVANTNVELNKVSYIKHEIKSTLGNKYVKLAIVVLVFLLLCYIAFIIMYNINRSKKKKKAANLARKRIEELRRNEEETTGKSFEEIEAIQLKRGN